MVHGLLPLFASRALTAVLMLLMDGEQYYIKEIKEQCKITDSSLQFVVRRLEAVKPTILLHSHQAQRHYLALDMTSPAMQKLKELLSQ